MPLCSHTGVPRHFQVSCTSGNASWINARTRASVSPRQSPSSAMRASISSAAVVPASSGFGACVVISGSRRQGDRNGGLTCVLQAMRPPRSEEHTSELQSQSNLVCRLLLEKKKNTKKSEDEY